MLHHIFKRGIVVSAVFAAPKVNNVVDASNAIHPSGWERVQNVFMTDEYGSISPQLGSIYQTTFFSGFFGACYGGFTHSREAYLRFIERNEASKYADHFEAKKNLQDFVTVNFAKGAFKWSWRLALFSGLYMTFITVLSAYFGEQRIWHFGLGGLLSGTIYRLNLGLRGVIVGGTLGLIIGLFAGALTMTMLLFTGTSIDDINEWQSEIIKARSKHISEAAKKTNREEMLEVHDKSIKSNSKELQ